jgi:hypothetical protein
MKRVLLFSVLGIAYLLFSAKSCNSREEFDAAREQKIIKSTKDSVASAFASESPSTMTLHGYEQTAIIRFSDFWDYSNIICDTSTAFEFRNQAKQMLLELFKSKNCVINFVGRNEAQNKEFTLIELIDSRSECQMYLGNLKPDSVWISKYLYPVNDSIFTGKLSFSFNKTLSSTNRTKNLTSKGTINFFAVKRDKNFGKEILKVWTVLLGDTEFNER